jgi:hypothetical protein
MSLSKDIQELQRRLKVIETLSGQFGKNINTTNLNPVKENAEEINSIYRDLLQQQRDFNSEIEVSISSFNEVLNSLKKTSNSISQSKKSLGSLTSIAQKLSDSQKGYNDLSLKQLETLQSQAKSQRQRLKESKDGMQRELVELQAQEQAQKTLIAQKKKIGGASQDELKELQRIRGQIAFIGKNYNEISDLVDGQNAGLEVLNDELNQAITYTKNVSKNFDIGAASIDGMGVALGKLGLGKLSEKLGLDEAKTKMKSLSQQFADELQLEKDLTKQYSEKKKAQAPNMSDAQIAAGKGGQELKNLLDQRNSILKKNNSLSQTGKQYKVLKAGVSSLGKSLVSNLLSPTSLILSTVTFIVDAFKSLDAGAGDLAKGMNITYSEALNVREELTGMANASYDTGVNTKGLHEALMGVNSELGTNGMLSEETLTTMTKLNKQAGISMKTQAGLFKISANTGKTYKDTFQTFQASAKLESKRLGVAINTKQLMDEVANMSAATQMSIKGGVEGLAKQATQVKAMGLSFSKLEGIADNLLQFESSIENELQAELLLGQDLNLEKARQLALNNDLAGVARELNAQGITSAKFADMNRIQQEAAAKAMGMNRDAMAEMLRDQEAIKAVGGSLNKEEMAAYEAAKKKYGAEKAAQMLKEGQLDQMVAQQSLSEKFNDSIVKLQEIFQTVVVALSPILEIFMSILSVVGPIVGVVGQLITKLMPVLKYLLPIVAAFKTIKYLSGGVLKNFKLSNIAAKLGLVTTQQAATAEKAKEMISKDSLATEKIKGYYKEKTLGKVILTNVQEKIGNALQTAKNFLLGEEGGLQTMLRGIKNSTFLLNTKDYLLEKGKMLFGKVQLGLKYAMNIAERVGNAISKGGLLLDIGQAVMDAMSAVTSGVGKLLGPLAIPLALAAGATVGAIGYKFMSGNDVFSPGHGQRTLMGPEGAIGLNNKDTVIAGTNLFDSDPSPKEQSPIVQVSNSNQQTTQTDTNSEILTELKTANAQRNQGNSYLERDTSVSTIKVQ